MRVRTSASESVAIHSARDLRRAAATGVIALHSELYVGCDDGRTWQPVCGIRSGERHKQMRLARAFLTPEAAETLFDAMAEALDAARQIDMQIKRLVRWINT